MKNKKQKLNIYQLNFIRETLFNIGRCHCSIKLYSGEIVAGAIVDVKFNDDDDGKLIKHSTTFEMFFYNKDDKREVITVDMFDIENIRIVKTTTFDVMSRKRQILFKMEK